MNTTGPQRSDTAGPQRFGQLLTLAALVLAVSAIGVSVLFDYWWLAAALLAGIISAGIWIRRRAATVDPAWLIERDIELYSRLLFTIDSREYRLRLASALQQRAANTSNTSPDSALADLDRAIEVLKTDEADSESDETPHLKVRCHLARAYARYHRGEFSDALEDHDHTLELLASISDPGALESRAMCEAGRGDTLTALRRFEEGVRAYDGAVLAYRELLEKERDDLRASFAATLNHRGYALDRTDRKAEAEESFRDAAAIYSQLFKETKSRSSEIGLAMSHTGLGCVLGSMQRYADAVDAHQHAIAIFDSVLADTRSHELLENLALNLSGSGVCKGRNNATRAAKEDLDRSLSIYEELIEAGATDLDKERELVKRELNKLA